ncbi:MAG UNVERIFIED_CONTAM: hypothetical protein LVR18_42240 [Planctomycetaceae bacterium]
MGEFPNSICLIIYIAVGYQLINLIPRGVLASVLLYTGWKMCEPAVWRHVAHVGRDQLIVSAFTVLVTVATDLLMGIIPGQFCSFCSVPWPVARLPPAGSQRTCCPTERFVYKSGCAPEAGLVMNTMCM